MAKRTRADGNKFARDTAADLSCAPPAPLFPLSPRAEKYWPRVIASKRLAAWTDSDLDLAISLCEDFAKLEELRIALRSQPLIIKDEQKGWIDHPAHDAIEKVQRRIMATQRALQIHSLATNGATHRQGDKNATARHLGSVIVNADPILIPRPLENA